MKQENAFLDALWFVAGPALLLGGLLSFHGDRIYDGFKDGESQYSELFYSYPVGAILVAVCGLGLLATELMRRRRMEVAARLTANTAG